MINVKNKPYITQSGVKTCNYCFILLQSQLTYTSFVGHERALLERKGVYKALIYTHERLIR